MRVDDDLRRRISPPESHGPADVVTVGTGEVEADSVPAIGYERDGIGSNRHETDGPCHRRQ